MINIHAREITDELASLVKSIDGLVDSAKSRDKDAKHAFLTLLTDDPDQAEKDLEALAKKHKIENMPLTVFDRVSGPKNYKIAKDAQVTVMMWKGQKVAINHAFGKGELTKESAKKVLADAKKHLE